MTDSYLTIIGTMTEVHSVASLGWVTPEAATEGATPLFFPEKPGDLFLVASSLVSPLISSSQKLTDLFCSSLYRFLLHSGVIPSRVSPHTLFYLSDLVSPLFFVNLPTKIFFLRVSPPWRVSPGAVRPPRPRLVTPLGTFMISQLETGQNQTVC